MTTFLLTSNSKTLCSPPIPKGMEIPKELLQKAAESALISSFVGLNLHPATPSPQNHTNGSITNGSSPASSGSFITTTTTSSSKITNGSSTPLKSRPSHPTPGQTHKVVIEIDLDKEGTSSPCHSATSFFVKSIPTGCSGALKELTAYETLVPELYPDHKSKKTVISAPPTLPHCFLTHQSKTTSQKALLFLENLQVSGFRPCEDVFDFNHALLAVQTLARFHAQSYFLLRQLGSKAKGRLALGNKYPWLVPGHNLASSSKCASVYSGFFEQILLPILEGENPSLAFKLRRKIPHPETLYPKLGAMLDNEKYENDDLYVICHGDYRVGHLLFKYDSGAVVGEEVVECRMVDLKNVRIAPLASDLVYFMFTSLPVGIREDFEEKLIAFYCDSFEAQLKLRYSQEGSVLKDEDFDIEDFHRKVEDQYRRMLEYGFYACVSALPLIHLGLNTGVLENLGDVYLGGGGENGSTERCGSSVLDSLQNSDKFSQLAKECLNSEGLRESLVGVVKRLVKARIF